ncbi:MAG: hypothetical protein RIF33_10225 [Cyclobacteriaceae bacterium]
MKTIITISLLSVLSFGKTLAQAPTDSEWMNFWENFRGAVNTGVPEKVWDYMIFPIPGNGVDQESFLVDFGTYFPQSALIGIIEYDPADLVLVENHLDNMDTNDSKLIRMRIERSGFTSEYYFGRVDDTIYLLDVK